MLGAHDNLGIGDLVDVTMSDFHVRGRFAGFRMFMNRLHVFVEESVITCVCSETGELRVRKNVSFNIDCREVDELLILEGARFS